MRRRLGAIIGGLVVGAGLATAGVALAPESTDETVPTAGTATTEPTVWWHDPNETIVSTAAVILETIIVERGQAVLTYRVEPISSAPIGHVFADHDHPPIAPEDWVLETQSGEYRASSNRSYSSQVRFDVDDGFTTAGVVGVRIERYRMLLPYSFDIELPVLRGASTRAGDGVRVAVVSVLEQSSSVGVGIGIGFPVDTFTSGSAAFGARAVDPRWPDPTPRTPSAEYPNAWQFTWPSPEPPGHIGLRVTGSRWVTRDTDIPLDIGGLRHAG